jgi:hypothetical protein
MKLRRLPKIEFIWDKSEVLFGTLCFGDTTPPPPPKGEKREDPSLHDATSERLHGNSIPKIGCHYFWPGLIALPKNTLPVELISHLMAALDLESGLKGLGANFEHFWIVVWPQVTNPC